MSIALAESLRTRPAVEVTLPWRELGGELRTYAHLMPDDQDRSRAAIDAVRGNLADCVRTGDVS